MRTFDYELESEFTDAAAERTVLEVIAARGELSTRWVRQLRPELFASQADIFEVLRQGGSLPLDRESTLATEEEFLAAIARLDDLEVRRRLARLQQNLGESLFDLSRPANDSMRLLEESFRGLTRTSSAGLKVDSGTDLALGVLDLAEKRLAQRRATGRPVMGISTGLTKLDQMLNGWFPGLHVVAAGPGVGKTTLCLQFAWEAASQGYPVLYVSYENAARNLLLKLLCARAGISPSEVERGYGDMDKLQAAWRENEIALSRLHVIEGDSRLRIASVEAAMREISQGQPGLIVFDYLQRAAHSLGYEQLRQNVSLLTGELRELSMRLDCPLLAISSQNRAAGDYGKGGTGALDSLKESGDLEYGADTVSLLYAAQDSSAAPPARELELKIAKNRFGATGAMRVIFRPDIGVFRERA